LTGIFVYKFVMSREASFKWGKIGVFCNLPISSRMFSVLYVLGRGQAVWFSVWTVLQVYMLERFANLQRGWRVDWDYVYW